MKIRALITGGLIGGVLCLQPAFGSIFVRIPNVPGESTATGHLNDIVVQSFSWGVTGPSGTNTTAFTDLTISKIVDKSSPTLALDCATGTNLASLTLYVNKTAGGSGTVDYYIITLSDVTVTTFTANAATGNPVSESVSFRFRSIQWSYTPFNTQGVPQTPIVTSYTLP